MTVRDRRLVDVWPWLLAVAGPIAVSAVMVPFRSDIRASNVSLVLVVVVVVAAIGGGRLGGAIAAVVSAFSYDFFFTRPYYSLRINSRDDIETTVLLLIVGVLVGELVVRARRSRRVAAETRFEMGRMQRLAELAAGGEPPQRLIYAVQEELASLFDLTGCRFERPPFKTSLPSLGHKGVMLRAPKPGESAELTAPNRIELPVWGEGHEVGRFVLDLRYATTGIALPVEGRASAVALADQLGAILAVADGDRPEG